MRRPLRDTEARCPPVSGEVATRYRAFDPPTCVVQAVFEPRIVQSSEKESGRREGRIFAELPVARNLSIPPQDLRRADGGNFPLRDIGPGAARILTFGRECNIRSLARAGVWGADGAFFQGVSADVVEALYETRSWRGIPPPRIRPPTQK